MSSYTRYATLLKYVLIRSSYITPIQNDASALVNNGFMFMQKKYSLQATSLRATQKKNLVGVHADYGIRWLNLKI